MPIVVELSPPPAPVDAVVRTLEPFAPGFDQLTPAEPSVARANARRLRSVVPGSAPTPPLGTLLAPVASDVGPLELAEGDATERMPEVELIESPAPSPVTIAIVAPAPVAAPRLELVAADDAELDDAFEEAGSPVDVAAEPVDVAAEPVDVAAEPVDVAAEPVDVAAEPVDVAAEPVDVAAEPVDLTADVVDLYTAADLYEAAAERYADAGLAADADL